MSVEVGAMRSYRLLSMYKTRRNIYYCFHETSLARYRNCRHYLLRWECALGHICRWVTYSYANVSIIGVRWSFSPTPRRVDSATLAARAKRDGHHLWIDGAMVNQRGGLGQGAGPG